MFEEASKQAARLARSTIIAYKECAMKTKAHTDEGGKPTKVEVKAVARSVTSAEVEQFVLSGHADSTKRTHKAALNIATQCGPGPVFPIKIERLLLIVFVMTKCGYALATIDNYVSALKVQHRLAGFEDLRAYDVQRLKLAMMAAKKSTVQPLKNAKTPLNVEQVRAWIIESDVRSEIKLLAIICTFGLLRISEGIALNWTEVAMGEIDGVACHVVTVLRSKTDQAKVGDYISVSCSLGLGLLQKCSCVII